MNHLPAAALLLLLTAAAPVRAEIPVEGEVEQPERAIVTRYLLMDTRGNAVTG